MSDSGNAAVAARGRASISGREGAAFISARGGNESEMETARDTARVMETARDTARGMETARDTARGSETDYEYMSTVEPDTGRSTSTAFEVQSRTFTCTTVQVLMYSSTSCTSCCQHRYLIRALVPCGLVEKGPDNF